MDLAKLYSELRAGGYIRGTDSERYSYDRYKEPYVVTPAGVERERFLISKHSRASAKLLDEVTKDSKRVSVHLAVLGALTLHDTECTRCSLKVEPAPV